MGVELLFVIWKKLLKEIFKQINPFLRQMLV